MKCSQTCQQNAFPIKPLSFTVTLFRKYPPQNQTAATHVQNEGKKTETGGVKPPKRKNTDGKTNQIKGGSALFVFYSCRDCPSGYWGMQIRFDHLSIILTEKTKKANWKDFPTRCSLLMFRLNFEWITWFQSLRQRLPMNSDSEPRSLNQQHKRAISKRKKTPASGKNQLLMICSPYWLIQESAVNNNNRLQRWRV